MSSIFLHPGIGELDQDSLCYSLYSQLYLNFFNAQDKKDAEHPWGVLEGDDTSIRLRNTAYNFADAISGAINGTGGNDGNALLDFLKKSGGDMTGKLTANFGFEAGIENIRILEAYAKEVSNDEGEVISKFYGIRVTGNLDVGNNNLYIGGKQLLHYDHISNTATLSHANLSFGQSFVSLKGELTVGDNKENGIFITPNVIQVSGHDVFHNGNANLSSVDWQMKDAIASGSLNVQGNTTLFGKLKALAGFELGINNNTILSIDGNNVYINNFLSFGTGFGIKIKSIPVLIALNNNDIQIGAAGGDLLLGGGNTLKTKLAANITDENGTYPLLSKHGAAYFPDSLKISHNFGEILLSSYRVDSADEGMIVHKKLRFGNLKSSYLYGKPEGISFVSAVEYMNANTGERTVSIYETLLKYHPSTSKFQDLSRVSDSFVISTDADFIVLDKPLEAKTHIGIEKSFTRLTAGALFFENDKFFLSVADGIKHYGNAYFLDGLSSELFSSGFAGTGWSISTNKTSGNITATFDELTIRKKMRIYELEVQKISATNGSLWISDNCSGDKVIKL